MARPATEAVMQTDALWENTRLEGQVTFDSWVRHVLTPGGKPDELGIRLLGHVLYWYRSVPESTGDAAVVERRRKFRGERLQLSYRQLEDRWPTYNRAQFKRALARLRDAGFITIDHATITRPDGAVYHNVMQVEPCIEAIQRITYPLSEVDHQCASYRITNDLTCTERPPETAAAVEVPSVRPHEDQAVDEVPDDHTEAGQRAGGITAAASVEDLDWEIILTLVEDARPTERQAQELYERYEQQSKRGRRAGVDLHKWLIAVVENVASYPGGATPGSVKTALGQEMGRMLAAHRRAIRARPSRHREVAGPERGSDADEVWCLISGVWSWDADALRVIRAAYTLYDDQLRLHGSRVDPALVNGACRRGNSLVEADPNWTPRPPALVMARAFVAGLEEEVARRLQWLKSRKQEVAHAA